MRIIELTLHKADLWSRRGLPNNELVAEMRGAGIPIRYKSGFTADRDSCDEDLEWDGFIVRQNGVFLIHILWSDSSQILDPQSPEVRELLADR